MGCMAPACRMHHRNADASAEEIWLLSNASVLQTPTQTKRWRRGSHSGSFVMPASSKRQLNENASIEDPILAPSNASVLQTPTQSKRQRRGSHSGSFPILAPFPMPASSAMEPEQVP